MSRVVHCKRERYDVYIGRPSKWGNPFAIGEFQGQYRTREQVILAYEQWLKKQTNLLLELPALRGKVLGCWCHPKPCHGDVLIRLANYTSDDLEKP